eukprot:1090152-Amphidinium_carterae.1
MAPIHSEQSLQHFYGQAGFIVGWNLLTVSTQNAVAMNVVSVTELLRVFISMASLPNIRRHGSALINLREALEAVSYTHLTLPTILLV